MTWSTIEGAPAKTTDLTGKHCTVIFSAVFVFVFEKYNAGFLEPALAANARFADSFVWKNKSFLWKRRRQEKKTAFLHTLFVENERETSKLK